MGIGGRTLMRGNRKLHAVTPKPKMMEYPSNSQPTRLGESAKTPAKVWLLCPLCVSRNGNVGPSQSPTTELTQSHTGARCRRQGTLNAFFRPARGETRDIRRLPIAPVKMRTEQSR